MEKVKIDIVPSGVMPNAHASQYDIGRKIRFILTNFGESYELTGAEDIFIVLRKPDNSEMTISLENTSSDYVDWVSSDGELDLAGLYLAEIRIEEGSALLGSANFLLKVEEDPFNGQVEVKSVGPADICTFTTTLPEPLVSLKAEIKAVQASGTPSPSNPLPITGFSECNITACGVNLFDKTNVFEGYIIDTNGNFSTRNGDASTDFISVVGGARYYVKSEQTSGMWGSWYDENKEYISACTGYANGVITAPTTAKFVRLTAVHNSGNVDTFGINYPSTDHDYHAYNGQTATIDLNGTRYGGVLDVTRGVLTVTHGEIASYNGEQINEPWLSSMDVYSSGDTPTTGAQVVYPLATPFEIALTPTQISAIAGQNNVFSDTGECEVKYLDRKV